MKVKPVNPENAAGLIDPQTLRSPFLDEKGAAIESADVPDNTFWRRRLLAKEVALDERSAPTGNEPIAPLTTRGGK
jgi:hypothetical protein